MQLWSIIVLGVALVFLALTLALVAPRRSVRGDELDVFPLESSPIMTKSEELFFHTLLEALPEYHIFCQVQFSRIVRPQRSLSKKDRYFWFNRISRLSLDYVLVCKENGVVAAAIELDDWTHKRQENKKRDIKKDKALMSANIPLIRFHVEDKPSSGKIRSAVIDAVNKGK